MTSSNDVINFSISAYHLWRHRWRHRGRTIKNKYKLELSYKDANLGIFFEGIGSQTKKLWPRVLYMTSSLFPSITQISKIAANHNFWPKCVLCKALISCMTFHLNFFLEKLKMKNLKKTRNFTLKNTLFRHMWRHRGRKNIKKYFLKIFFSFPKFKKKIMTIGLLEKKLQGGGVKITPLPYYFIGNSQHEEGVNELSNIC